MIAEQFDDSAYDFEFDVDVKRSFSEAEPARLEVSLRNTAGRERRVTVGSEDQPFSSIFPDEPAIGSYPVPDDLTWIVPEDSDPSDGSTEPRPFPPQEQIDGCWRLERNVSTFYGAKWISLAPGDAVTGLYSVYGSPHTVECLPPGTCPFTGSTHFDADEPVGFTLRLE